MPAGDFLVFFYCRLKNAGWIRPQRFWSVRIKGQFSTLEPLLIITFFSFESIRKSHCPLLDVAMRTPLPAEVQSQDYECIQSDENKVSKEIERLKRLNSVLYSQLIEKTVQN